MTYVLKSAELSWPFSDFIDLLNVTYKCTLLRVLKNRDRFYTLFIFLKRKSFGHFRVFQLSSKDKVLYKDLENYSNLKLKYLIFFSMAK